jgi:hypothetical protein
MSLEQLTFILTALNSTILAVIFIYLKFNVDKRLKKYEYSVGDTGELNRKMHDRLVEVTDCINHLEPIDPGLKKRLLMNASRLEKYDPCISEDVNKLFQTWNEAFYSDREEAVIDMRKYENKKTECLGLIDGIKTKVDKLVN